MTDPKKLAEEIKQAVRDAFNGRAQALGRAYAAIDQLSALAEKAERAWLPIETAPKDGTPVLLVSANAAEPSPEIGHWSDEDGCFRVGYPDDWFRLAEHGLRSWLDIATHWQPLPPAPGAPATPAQPSAREARLMALADAYARSMMLGDDDKAAQSHRNRLRVELAAALSTGEPK
jgi:hypothetical protein